MRDVGIPGYRVLRELGRGGMAVVYLAVQESLGREVALKVFEPAAGQDPVGAERFLREARMAASLHHPHIVPVHDLGVLDGLVYIAMEYEPSGTVAPLSGQRLEPGAALRIVREIADALDYAHSRGVVHRDIKPDNILRGGSGAAMLSDFGIARLFDGQTRLTAEGTSVGTPHYMSPEQLRGDKLDGRSDLYSLGVVLFQLLTGELPYSGSDVWSIGTQHLTAEVPRLPGPLAQLQPLVDTLMAKSPDHRPRTGADVVRLVDALLADQARGQGAIATPTRPIGSPPPPRTGVPRRWLAWAGLVVAVAAVAGVVGWNARKPAAPPPGQPAAVAEAEPPSIAVMAFDDLSADKDQGYFSEGVSEEVSSRLAHVPGLHVVGRGSSNAFKGKQASIAEIARTLGVTNVLEGSVRRMGDRARVTVQLSNARDGFLVWNETYDRKLTDIFAVQDEIAAAVVESLKLRLLPTAPRQHHVPPFEVYDLFLRGRQALTRFDQASFQVALDSFSQAVQRDPEYAEAWSGLAMAESFAGGRLGDPQADAQAQARALAAAEKAVSLDPELGDAFAARGYLRARNEWNWSGALEDIRRSIELEPSDARNQLRYGYLLATLGKMPEAIAALEASIAADPMFSPAWIWLARFRYSQRDFAGARVAVARAAAIDPTLNVEPSLGIMELMQGRPAAALAHFEKAQSPVLRALALHDLGQVEQAQAVLAGIGSRSEPGDFYALAQAYAWTGQPDQAFAWLDRALAAHDASLQWIPYDPLLQKLSDDPRMDRLLARMNLPR